MVLAILIRNVAFATQSCRETEMLGHSPSGTRFHFLISLAAHLKWSFHQAKPGWEGGGHGSCSSYHALVGFSNDSFFICYTPLGKFPETSHGCDF